MVDSSQWMGLPIHRTFRTLLAIGETNQGVLYPLSFFWGSTDASVDAHEASRIQTTPYETHHPPL